MHALAILSVCMLRRMESFKLHKRTFPSRFDAIAAAILESLRTKRDI